VVAASDTLDPGRVGEELTYDVLVVNRKIGGATGVRLSSSPLPVVDAGCDVISSQGRCTGRVPRACG
jgi:hypothetical protein